MAHMKPSKKVAQEKCALVSHKTIFQAYALAYVKNKRIIV